MKQAPGKFTAYEQRSAACRGLVYSLHYAVMQRDSSKDRHEPLNGFWVIVGEETAFALVRCLNRCGNNHGDTAPPPMPARPGSQPTPEESGGAGKNASSAAFFSYIYNSGSTTECRRTAYAHCSGGCDRSAETALNPQPEHPARTPAGGTAGRHFRRCR